MKSKKLDLTEAKLSTSEMSRIKGGQRHRIKMIHEDGTRVKIRTVIK